MGAEQEESVGALIGRLVEDGKGYVRAEIGYYKALIGAKLAEAKGGLIFGVVALVLLHLALIGFVVGLVLTLSSFVGPGLATLIVVVAFLAVAGLLGWLAAKHFQRAFGSKP